MKHNIDEATVRRVARLARLKLNEAEVDEFGRQLSRVIEHFQKLESIDTDKIEPLNHPHGAAGAARDDTVRPSLSADEALANAPQCEGMFFRVPKVLDQQEGA